MEYLSLPEVLKRIVIQYLRACRDCGMLEGLYPSRPYCAIYNWNHLPRGRFVYSPFYQCHFPPIELHVEEAEEREPA
jgi:hypothetical protein